MIRSCLTTTQMTTQHSENSFWGGNYNSSRAFSLWSLLLCSLRLGSSWECCLTKGEVQCVGKPELDVYYHEDPAKLILPGVRVHHNFGYLFKSWLILVLEMTHNRKAFFPVRDGSYCCPPSHYRSTQVCSVQRLH